MCWIIRLFKVLAIVAGLLLAAFLAVKTYQQFHRLMLPPAERLLAEADALADRANWRAATPLYQRAEGMGVGA